MSDQERIAFREWIANICADKKFYRDEMQRLAREAVRGRG